MAQEQTVTSGAQHVDSRERDVARLKRQLEEAESQLARARLDHSATIETLDVYKKEAEQFPFVDLNPINAEINGAAEKNAAIRENVKVKTLREQLGTAQQTATNIDRLCQDKLNDKAKMIQSATYPLPGLSVTDDCVLFNSIPLKQASTAQQIKISAAIGIALNPQLRVMLIRDGAFLDDANLAALREMAEDNDVQLWIERVGKGQECSVVIEDGAIAEDRTKPNPEWVSAPVEGKEAIGDSRQFGQACTVNT